MKLLLIRILKYQLTCVNGTGNFISPFVALFALILRTSWLWSLSKLSIVGVKKTWYFRILLVTGCWCMFKIDLSCIRKIPTILVRIPAEIISAENIAVSECVFYVNLRTILRIIDNVRSTKIWIRRYGTNISNFILKSNKHFF